MIYLVEDDSSIRELVIYSLENTGYAAQGFDSSAKLFEAIKKEKPKLILLDIMLPFEDGLSILKRIRKEDKKTPIIMLTAKSSEYDKVLGLDLGADDYITKPFGMMELISRIKAILRRSFELEEKTEFKYQKVKLDTKAHTVTVDNNAITLTLKEFELLELMMKNMGNVMTREVLLEKIWGFDYDGETRTVDVHIRTLRSKLGDDINIIETVRGVGYRIGEK